MRFIIIGAGAVGATIGGRLAQNGHEVVLVARGAHAETLRADGLRLSTADGTHVHRLPVATGPAETGALRRDDVLLLAVKTQDAVAALDTWGDAEVAGGGTAAQRLPVFCLQNGVEAERLALRRFARVYGVCVWLPSTFLHPGSVSALCAPLTGILHLGLAAGGADATAREVAGALEASGFGAPVVEDVMRWKYAKLLGNLGNAIQATTGPEPDPAKGALLRRAIREAEAAFGAAGIAYASEAEQSAAREGRVNQPEGVRGGSSWQSLARGTGSIEADYLNGEISLLGRLHGVPTPVNDVLRHAANIFARKGLPPGAMSVGDLTALADEAAARASAGRPDGRPAPPHGPSAPGPR
ncbi:ketopantoate reductase family protein [Streptomyces sp. WAC05374]|uniref:ketopantoate reductase family protein n=1 Tax=Streptomyces sp. WAC05374 TaxID=2487420 RepID=UPI000F8659D6|nr:2-dehydropantoate 2-reductase N-terminal domain-containing protein [Streptomyces sp. WAC05374]RST13822.1 ketopantoate reductase family protein [Streptomyces sp. WAC05374]TDF52669.1 ketopantoate reductase family protein [Streptomyces sp. WAC05374]TDF54088.1 ketopantoate reductase family protein [Streptomyces sp. WAC05374]